MNEKKSGEFERSVDRLDEIITMLDTGKVPLEELLAFVREGSDLIKKCEAMLKDAQAQVDAALRPQPPGGAAERDPGALPF